jgi:Ca2+-binding EF-hand superfamily protein
MDDDQNRKLNLEEFKKGVEEYGLNFSKAEIEDLFHKIDADNSGTIDFDEFLRRLRVCFTLYKRNQIQCHSPIFYIDILASNE